MEICRKSVSLQRVFHSIRFKVNKKDWLSGIDSLFLCSFSNRVFLKGLLGEIPDYARSLERYYPIEGARFERQYKELLKFRNKTIVSKSGIKRTLRISVPTRYSIIMIQ